MARQIKAKVGTYTNQEGKECGDYVSIGVILSNENGDYALIDPTVNLAGVLMKQRISSPGKKGDMVMCSIFDNDRQQQAPAAAPSDPFEDDINF